MAKGPFGVFMSQPPLQDASRHGHTETVSLLLKAGADPNTGLTVGPAVDPAVGPFGAVGYGSPLTFASMAGHTEVVAALLKAGVGPTPTASD